MHKAVTGALWAACLTLLGTSVALARTSPIETRLNGLQDFTLEFAQPMQNWDNAVRRDLVRLTPALPATCSWDSDTRLACHLDSKFALATRYRLDIAPGLKTQTGAVLAAQTLHVETERPSVVISGEATSMVPATASLPAGVRAVALAVDTGSAYLPASLLGADPQSRRGCRARRETQGS